MSSTLRIAVVGAGPAGVSAAVNLVRAGHTVTMIDKATFPRDKTCGDGLTTAALRQLQSLGLDAPSLPSWRVVNHTTWRSPSAHAVDLDVVGDGVRIAVVRRYELDAALVDLARRNGADVQEDTSFEGIEAAEHGIELRTNKGPVRADFAIGADGMYSPLRRAAVAATKPYLGEIHAFRQYFANVTGPAKDRLWVSFEPDILPGYVWSFPVGDGGANVGFGVQRREGESVSWMRDAWPDILQRPHVREALGEGATPEGPHKAWPIPANIAKAELSALDGRVLFVGDAARSVDPLTGEGIAQALETGEMAAHAIATTDTPVQAAARYRRSIRWGMAVDHGFATTLTRLVRHQWGARMAIRMAPLGPWRGRYAIRWVFEDNPRAGLLTPWRWRRRFATKAPAYAAAGRN